MAKSRIWLVCLGVASIAMAWWWGFHQPTHQPTHHARATPFEGDSSELHDTIVVPTLDTPIPAGKSAIWCGSFQLAWNRFETVVGAPVRIRNAADVVARLNRAEFSEKDLDPDMVYSAAGLNKDGIGEQIRADMQRRFPGVPVPDLGADDAVATAFAYLKAEVDYDHPYMVAPDPFEFIDSRRLLTRVSGFGIPKGNKDVPKMVREQVQMLHFADRRTAGGAEFCLDLCKHSARNQIVLACVERRQSLAETLTDLESKRERFRTEVVKKSPREENIDINDLLLVPNMYWRVHHHFAELEGEDKTLLNPKWQKVYLANACRPSNSASMPGAQAWRLRRRWSTSHASHVATNSIARSSST